MALGYRVASRQPVREAIAPARSELMSRVRGKNTKPEIVVRQTAHRLGFRFRLHRRDLPGSPDLVFPSRKKVIFVHGCFWHRHSGCSKASTPKTRTDFWITKFEANVRRDSRSIEALEALGWKVCVIWECETSDYHLLEFKLKAFLGKSSSCRTSSNQKTLGHRNKTLGHRNRGL